LFIEVRPARYNVSYNALYAARLVFGTNDSGLIVPNGQTATNQYRPQTINGFTFVPRILQGFAPSTSAWPATQTNNAQLVAEPASNEWDDIVCRTLVGCAGINSKPWSTATVDGYGRFTNLRDEFQIGSSSASYADICQQAPLLPNTLFPWRGGRYKLGSYSCGPCASCGVTLASQTVQLLNGNTGVTVTMCWRQVLELVL
jgi:hypothetical protein